MLTTSSGTRGELHPGEEARLAAYRYGVFVERLGWALSCERGLERDRFDRVDTVYVIAKDEAGFICGCARLLPTTQPYLLAEICPELLHGTPPPASGEVWELSRFSTQPAPADGNLPREEARRRFCVVFAEVVRAARQHGAVRLITFTALAGERIFRSIGIHAHRVGPPIFSEGKPIVAMWVELDRKTCDALDMRDAHCMQNDRGTRESGIAGTMEAAR